MTGRNGVMSPIGSGVPKKIASELFGSRVGASHAPRLGASWIAFSSQQLGDAEIQQFDTAVHAD